MEEQFRERTDRFWEGCLKIKEEVEAPAEDLSVCEKKLEEWGFPSGEERLVAARYLVGNKEEKDMDAVCKRMKLLQKNIAGSCLGQADQSSWTAALILAVSGIKIPEFQQRMRRIRELLQKWLPGGSNLQDIANMILLFQVDDIALCERGINIYQAFRKRGYPLASHHAAALAGLLALSTEPAGELADHLIETGEQWEPGGKKDIFLENPYRRLAAAAGGYLQAEAEQGKEGKLSFVALASLEINFMEALNTICLCCIIDKQI